MATELAVETIRSLPIYRVESGWIRGVNQYGQVSFNCLNRLKYSERSNKIGLCIIRSWLLRLQKISLTKGSEFDVKRPSCFV